MSFCINEPCQFTPPLNLHSLMSSWMLFSWLNSWKMPGQYKYHRLPAYCSLHQSQCTATYSSLHQSQCTATYSSLHQSQCTATYCSLHQSQCTATYSRQRDVLHLFNCIFFYLKIPRHTEYKKKTIGTTMNKCSSNLNIVRCVICQ